jgi:hypothetical protein
MKVVSLEAASEYLHQPSLSHLFFDGRVAADVEENVETDKKEFILFPDENIEFFKLRPGCDSVIFVVASPHLDVLAVEEIESLDLVLEDLHYCDAHFVLGQQFLELLVVAENVKNAQNVD